MNNTSTTASIVADTSLYPKGSADRILAQAEVIKAKRAGKAVQSLLSCGTWNGDSADSWCCDCPDLDYRVKPEPVVATETHYELYVPGPGYVGSGSRSGMLAEADKYVGELRIDEVEVIFHDGVQVSRKVHRL